MRTCFLSEALVFPNQKQCEPVVVPYEQDEQHEGVILQCANPFSQMLNNLAKHHQVDLWVVAYTCSLPQKFLFDLAEAGAGEEQVMLITCPCIMKSSSRVVIPDPFKKSPQILGACKDGGAALLRGLFEQWMCHGTVDSRTLAIA